MVQLMIEIWLFDEQLYCNFGFRINLLCGVRMLGCLKICVICCGWLVWVFWIVCVVCGGLVVGVGLMVGVVCEVDGVCVRLVDGGVLVLVGFLVLLWVDCRVFIFRVFWILVNFVFVLIICWWSVFSCLVCLLIFEWSFCFCFNERFVFCVKLLQVMISVLIRVFFWGLF